MLPDDGPVTVVVLVDQLKSVDAKACKLEDFGQKVSNPLLDNVLARLATLIS